MSFEAPSWLVTFLQGISVWDAVLWVVGLILTLIFIRKKGWRSVIAFARAILSTVELIDSVKGLPAFIARTDATLATQNDTLAAQDKRISEIHHETHTNNGSSIKDAVARVEIGVKGLYDKVGELTAVDVQMRKDFEDTQGDHQ